MTWEQILMKTGMQGQRMKQGEQGQIEGCQRCDGNRVDLRQGKCSREGVVPDGLCQRSISDLISNKEAEHVMITTHVHFYLVHIKEKN